MSLLAAPAFGLALVLLGLAFLRRHRRTWRDRKNDPALDHEERKFYHRQYRRRLLTSGLIVLLGILIPAGDLFFVFFGPRLPRNPAMAAFGFYWLGVLSIVLGVLLLGVFDLVATGMHAKDAILRVRGERATLERQLEEVRRALREEAQRPADDPARGGRETDRLHPNLRDGRGGPVEGPTRFS